MRRLEDAGNARYEVLRVRRASAESRDSSQHISTAAQTSKASETSKTSEEAEIGNEEAEIGNEEAEIGKGIGSELGCENENGN